MALITHISTPGKLTLALRLLQKRLSQVNKRNTCCGALASSAEAISISEMRVISQSQQYF